MIILGMDCLIPESSDYIGVDRGALKLAEAGIRMKLAVGDFDSVDAKDMEMIRVYADEMLILNPVKDDTDSEKAIRMAAERYQYLDVYGGLGGRLDHALINLKLAELFPGRVTLHDEHNEVRVYLPGIYRFHSGHYTYFSILPLTNSIVSLSGMKYELKDREITPEDLYTTSNEITADEGVMDLKKGKVIVIRSAD